MGMEDQLFINIDREICTSHAHATVATTADFLQ